MTLAMGETTSGVARQFKVSPARISQLREELKISWEKFHERGQHQAGGACPHGQVALSE
jgi:DNA-binding transcriptional regulator YiaG